jgi:hypothetical protein
MRRIITMLTVAALLAAMLVVAGPASAQGGCQTFGAALAAEGKAGILRDEVRNIAPANDEVHFFHGALCA